MDWAIFRVPSWTHYPRGRSMLRPYAWDPRLSGILMFRCARTRPGMLVCLKVQ